MPRAAGTIRPGVAAWAAALPGRPVRHPSAEPVEGDPQDAGDVDLRISDAFGDLGLGEAVGEAHRDYATFPLG
jgi:hypothetical protein